MDVLECKLLNLKRCFGEKQDPNGFGVRCVIILFRYAPLFL